MDWLSVLLSQFGIRAGTFHIGTYCSVTEFDDTTRHGHIHFLRSGCITIALSDGVEIHVSEPSLIFLPGPYRHKMIANETDKAELVCASVHFDGGEGNPLVAAFPHYSILPIHSVPSLNDTLEWLFKEAFGGKFGKTAVTDRLIELIVIQLLRRSIDEGALDTGILAGMADARISKALNMIHNSPHYDHSVEDLATACHMSRASFASHFRTIVGTTPASYLLGWRIGLAQKMLREGLPVSVIAEQVGYESASALARAFKRKTGLNPRQWMENQD